MNQSPPPSSSSSPTQSGRPATLDQWVIYLQSLIKLTQDPHTDNETLEAELLKPYSLTTPLILHQQYRNAPQAGDPRAIAPDIITGNPSRYPDIYLWWALVDRALDPLRIIHLHESASLVPQDLFTTIEVWTETELATLHALSHHAHHLHRTDLDHRIRRALDWHTENTQPDNATNHPWAVNAFLLRNTPESIHFAETLINNCMVQNARPDPFSARILRDAANALTNHQ